MGDGTWALPEGWALERDGGSDLYRLRHGTKTVAVVWEGFNDWTCRLTREGETKWVWGAPEQEDVVRQALRHLGAVDPYAELREQVARLEADVAYAAAIVSGDARWEARAGASDPDELACSEDRGTHFAERVTELERELAELRAGADPETYRCDLTEAWHLGGSGHPLSEALGMTGEEYGRWVADPSSVPLAPTLERLRARPAEQVDAEAVTRTDTGATPERVASNPPVRLEPAGEVASGADLVDVISRIRQAVLRYDGADLLRGEIASLLPAPDEVWPAILAAADQLRQHLDIAHGPPVDDQPPAADERHLPDVGAEQGALDAGLGDLRTVGVGEVGPVGDVVEDEGHAATVAQAFERGECG